MVNSCMAVLAVTAPALEAASLRSGGMQQRLCAGATGSPTHYRPSGCWRTTGVEDKVVYDGYQLVSHEECFAFCAAQKGMHYFGVAEGSDCWCGSIWHGSQLDDKSCDETCGGNDLQKCGGIDAANVFVMYDCTEDSAEQKAAVAQEATNKLLDSFGAFTGQTCGQGEDSKAEVDGAENKIGSVDDCKLACWNAPGAETCHGFTYDEDSEKCTFHQDVLDGDVVFKPRTQCYFKMI